MAQFRVSGLAAAAIILLMAVVATALVGGEWAAILTLVSGTSAIAIVRAAAFAPPSPPSAPLPADILPAERVIEGVILPMLIVSGGTVRHANKAARVLLGDYIVGEDVRLAIRHPAAAERLTAPNGGIGDAPVELVGLGAPDQHWEMRVAGVGDGTRVIHLIDQSGHYAAERMRVDFVANASHELRTPLASVLGFVETLGEVGDDRETRERFLTVMANEARRMQRLVEDLISLSRIEAEKYRAPSERVALDGLAREVVGQVRAADTGRGADLVLTSPDALPVVAGDRAQLSQMLYNVVGNAMKYGRAATPVAVTLSAQANAVRITITDRGDGIAAKHLPRLTERFYRADPGRSRSLGGTGLGLAIVKHIVERHRGELGITSIVGEGTTVTILLPALPTVTEM